MATLTQSNIGGPPPTTPDLPTGGGGGDDRDRPDRGGSRQASITGIVVLMCASIMTFASFVSAMVVRRGLNTMDWHHFQLPRILWWNTGVLIVSSILIDAARRVLAHNRRKTFNWLWTAGCVLGITFLVGQIIAWTQLEHRGLYIGKGPATAFFYVLTWSHAAHVIGALCAVLYVEYRALRWELGPGRRTMVVVSAIFWHFLDVLWLGIMGLFVFWA